MEVKHILTIGIIYKVYKVEGMSCEYQKCQKSFHLNDTHQQNKNQKMNRVLWMTGGKPHLEVKHIEISGFKHSLNHRYFQVGKELVCKIKIAI